MPEIISRAQAKARGLQRYFTGIPCKHGHLAERTCSNGTCVECAKISDKKSRPKKWRLYRAKHRTEVNRKEAERQRKNRRLTRPDVREKHNERMRKRNRKITDMIAVLKETMPDLLKEFGL